jgi:hypothetical protein
VTASHRGPLYKQNESCTMSEINEAVYAAAVRRAITAINPSVTDAGQACGWGATLDAVSTILMSLLIAAVGGDGARAACGRMYEDVTRLERAWTPISVPVLEDADEPKGHA